MRALILALLTAACGSPASPESPSPRDQAETGETAGTDETEADETEADETEADDAPSVARMRRALDRGWSCSPGFEPTDPAEVTALRDPDQHFLASPGAVCRRGDELQPLIPPHDEACRMRLMQQPASEMPSGGECGSCERDAMETWERERRLPRAVYWVCEECYVDAECGEGEVCAERWTRRLPRAHISRRAASPYERARAGPMPIFDAIRARVCEPAGA